MGLQVTEYHRDAYLDGNNFPEAEFLALGTGGEDVVMMPLQDVLAAKLFFTGYHGDKVWNCNNTKVSTDIIRGDASGVSLAEFRLRLGFIHLPVPFLGCIQHPSIHAISNSAEMQPWSTGGKYDRPIPRRLIEEYGVPGHLFGRQKKAISQPFGYFLPPEKLLSKKSHGDFGAFTTANPLFRHWGDRIFFACMVGLYQLNFWINRIIRVLGKCLAMHLALKPLVPEIYRESPNVHVQGFLWGMSKIKTRYSQAFFGTRSD